MDVDVDVDVDTFTSKQDEAGSTTTPRWQELRAASYALGFDLGEIKVVLSNGIEAGKG